MPQNNEEYLAHWGILGQKWGLRRYRNPDGTLTEEGKERYYQKSREAWKEKDKYRISDDELADRTRRLRLEATYMDALDSVNYPRYLDNHHVGFARELMEQAVTEKVVGRIRAKNAGVTSYQQTKGRNVATTRYRERKPGEADIDEAARVKARAESRSAWNKTRSEEYDYHKKKFDDYRAYTKEFEQEMRYRENGQHWLYQVFRGAENQDKVKKLTSGN